MRKEMDFLLDIIFYFLLPLAIWETSRLLVHDYAAIIFSSLPKVIYSLYRLFALKEFNFTRIFLFITILAGLSIDLFSGSALQVLWNSAFYSFGLASIYLISSLTNTPLFLYFALDVLVQQGYDKVLTQNRLFEKSSLNILKLLTISNAVNHFVYAFFVMQMASKEGIESYSMIMIIDQLLDFLMSGISVIGFVFIYKHLNEIKLADKIKSHSVKRKSPVCCNYWYLYNYERNYCFLSIQRW